MIAVITTAERRRYRASVASTLTKQNDTYMFKKLQYDTKISLNYHIAIFSLTYGAMFHMITPRKSMANKAGIFSLDQEMKGGDLFCNVNLWLS